MILNKKSITFVENDQEDCYQPASYDVRLDCAGKFKLMPGQSVLVSTIESLNLPNDVAVLIKDKSSLMRKGLAVVQGYVDPGFRGNLTLRIQNTEKRYIPLHYGQKIAQLVFVKTEPTEGYDGHYQDSKGVVKARQ